MDAPTIDDYRWLMGPEAEAYLRMGAALRDNLVVLANRLRQDLSAAQTHLVLEQTDLRRRASAKFPWAEQMFFERQLLEQATEQRISQHKAQRFPAGEMIADLCCGLGGDLLALSQRGPCLAVDKDPVACLLAETNCLRHKQGNVRFVTADIRDIAESLVCSAWHMDPDRRATGRRVSRVELLEPGMEVIVRLMNRAEAGAVKLAPATQWNAEEEIEVELEWISSRRECRQQVAWLGTFAAHPGSHTATVIRGDGQAYSFTGEADFVVDVGRPARFLYDTDAGLNAARLVGAHARSLSLTAIASWPSYLTSDQLITSPLLSAFEVEEILPLDVKRLKNLLRQRDIGTLEIKVCGVPIEPSVLRHKLAPRGSAAATLLIFGTRGEVYVALTRRIAASDD